MYSNESISGRRIRVLTLVAAVLLSASMLPLLAGPSDAADTHLAQPDSISVSPSVTEASLSAGESMRIYLDIRNELDFEEGRPHTLVVYIQYTEESSDIRIDFPNGNRVQIDGREIGYCEMVISVWEYATTTEHEISFDIWINDPDRGYPIRADASDMMSISVHSELSSGDSYNKILGYWPNPFPAPFDGSIVSAAISFMAWIAAAIVTAYFVLPYAIGSFRKLRKADADQERGSEEGRRR